MKQSYFIDQPKQLALVICVWWSMWAIMALLGEKFIYPGAAATLFLILSFVFYVVVMALTKKTINPYQKIDENIPLKYPFFKTQFFFVAVFFLFICLPEILKDPFGYRLNTFFDIERGIESVIYPNPFSQLLFTILYYYLPMTGLIISAFNDKRNVFICSAILLVSYALVTLSRGIYLTIFMLYIFSPGIKYRVIKIFLVLVTLVIFIPDYFDYQTLGFSLLEKFIIEQNLLQDLRWNGISTFNGFLWPILSIYRVFDESYKTSFEQLSSNNSMFVDIGRYENFNYNAFYTLMQGPVFDFGVISPVFLGLILGLILVSISRLRSLFLYRSFAGLLFFTCLNGNQMNSISDRIILIFLTVIIFIYIRNHEKFKRSNRSSTVI